MFIFRYIRLMKVIAIKDAPLVATKWPNGTNRAYYRDEVFEVIRHDAHGLIIRYYLTPTDDRLEVNEDNFIPLEEWRSERIDMLLEK